MVSSGTRFWDDLSDVPLDHLELQPTTRDRLREAFFFERAPFVGSVIFLATPHRGSFLAANWQGRLATRLTQVPGHLFSLPLDVARAGIGLPGMAVDLMTGELDLDEVRVQLALGRLPSSVESMNPSSAFIRTLADIPIEPPVVAHSIIPVRRGPPPDGQHDGVVDFESARIEEAQSEFVVFESGHSAQSHPEAIQEVRRILLARIDAAPSRGATKPPDPARSDIRIGVPVQAALHGDIAGSDSRIAREKSGEPSAASAAALTLERRRNSSSGKAVSRNPAL